MVDLWQRFVHVWMVVVDVCCGWCLWLTNGIRQSNICTIIPNAGFHRVDSCWLLLLSRLGQTMGLVMTAVMMVMMVAILMMVLSCTIHCVAPLWCIMSGCVFVVLDSQLWKSCGDCV